MEPICLSRYPRAVFFTGAGMSAESGVPTYRGRGGIWGQYRWEDYACQAAFECDPDKVLDFHEERRKRVLTCTPNAGHAHVAHLQASRPGISIITQNTDGLHQRAGATNVVELHGSLWRVRCSWHGSIEDLAAGPYAQRLCDQCGASLRPDITWFGDPVETEVFERAERLIADAQLFVAIGTSAVVYPAAGLIPRARLAGARMVEINPEETDLSAMFGEHIREPASTALTHWFLDQ